MFKNCFCWNRDPEWMPWAKASLSNHKVHRVLLKVTEILACWLLQQTQAHPSRYLSLLSWLTKYNGYNRHCLRLKSQLWANATFSFLRLIPCFPVELDSVTWTLVEVWGSHCFLTNVLLMLLWPLFNSITCEPITNTWAWGRLANLCNFFKSMSL